MEFENALSVQLEPCMYCGRKFAEESISRHENICQKTSQKRPVFDSSKQRDVKGGPAKFTKKPQTTSKALSSTSANRSNWRQKHDEFIQTIRAARGVTAALKQGKELPPPPPPAANPDYVQCPHCLRRFNETAAERHIPFCAEQSKRLANKKTPIRMQNNELASRASARQNYRPPLPQKSKNSINAKSASSYGAKAENVHVNKKSSRENPSFRSRPSLRTQVQRQNPEWDSTVDVPAETNQLTKTGLRPSSGINRQPTSKVVGRNKPTYQDMSKNKPLRKIAGKQKTDSYDQRNGRFGENPSAGMHIGSHVNNASKFQDPYFSIDHSQTSFENYNPTAYGNRRNPSQQHELHRTHARNKASEIDALLMSTDVPSSGGSKFCHECGSHYPVPNAKFCCECGVKRITIRM